MRKFSLYKPFGGWFGPAVFEQLGPEVYLWVDDNYLSRKRGKKIKPTVNKISSMKTIILVLKDR